MCCHRLLAEYILAAPSSLVAEAVENLAGPGLLRIVHTRDGAQAGCAVMAYGSPKERKKAIKALKGTTICLIVVSESRYRRTGTPPMI